MANSRSFTYKPNTYTNLFIWLAVIVLFFIAIKKPIQSWDILGYIAVVESQKTTDKGEIHRVVYNGVKHYATEDEFNERVKRVFSIHCYCCLA